MDGLRRMKPSLDFDAGFLTAAFGAVYAGVLAIVRGGFPGQMSGLAFGALVAAFAIAGFTVGSVIAGKPDFGPTKRAALVRGFVATIPVYAAGGLLFLAPDLWFSLIPLLSVAAAAIVGPPIGIFMYRLHRRVDSPEPTDESGAQLAWLKGELVGSWLPLLVSVALLAALGVGMRAIPAVDPTAARVATSAVPTLEQLPDLYRAIQEDSTDAGARYQLGVALTSLGGFSDAVTHLSIAVRADPGNALHWRALGRAAFFAQDYARATEAYWNAMRADPSVIGAGGIDRAAIDAALGLMLREEGEGGGDGGEAVEGEKENGT